MKKRAILLTLAFIAMPTASAQDWTITLGGVGHIRYGMTIAEVSEEGVRLVEDGRRNSNECYTVRPMNGPDALVFMVAEGRIVKFMLYPPSIPASASTRSVHTLSGIKIGSSEASLRQTYAGKLRREEGSGYGSMDYYYVPRDTASQNYSLTFTVEDGRVYSMWGGLLPYAGYSEGC